MNLKKFFNIFLVLFVILFANTSFAQDMRLAGFSRKAPVKPIQNKISGEDVMNSYMKDMEHRIKSNWFPQQDSFKNKTVVTFQIMRDGTIKSSRVSESSGDKRFDGDAMKAVQNTGKVAPLPNNVLGEYVDIIFTFERVSYLVKKDRYDR